MLYIPCTLSFSLLLQLTVFVFDNLELLKLRCKRIGWFCICIVMIQCAASQILTELHLRYSASVCNMSNH